MPKAEKNAESRKKSSPKNKKRKKPESRWGDIVFEDPNNPKEPEIFITIQSAANKLVRIRVYSEMGTRIITRGNGR